MTSPAERQRKKARQDIEDNKQFYSNLKPKPVTKALTDVHLRNITACISYCRHTNVKIAIGSTFTNSATAKKKGIVSSEHPIFALELPDIYAIYNECKTPTEKYIAMVAYLIKAKIVLTRECGFYFDEKQLHQVRDTFEEFLHMSVGHVHDSKAFDKFNFPMLSITEYNYASGSILATHIDECADIIRASNLNYYTSAVKEKYNNSSREVDKDFLKALYDEADLEHFTSRDLSFSDTKLKIYKNKINKWALEKLKYDAECEDIVIDFVRHQMFSPSYNLKAENITAAIAILEANLTYKDHEKESSHLVIQMLKHKLDEIKIAVEDFGFFVLSEEISTSVKGKVKLTSKNHKNAFGKDIQIVNNKPIGTTALDRLKNKFGKDIK